MTVLKSIKSVSKNILKLVGLATLFQNWRLSLIDAALFGTTRINNYHVEESSSGTPQ